MVDGHINDGWCRSNKFLRDFLLKRQNVSFDGAIINDGACFDGAIINDGGCFEGEIINDGGCFEGGLIFDDTCFEGRIINDGALKNGDRHQWWYLLTISKMAEKHQFFHFRKRGK